MNDNTRGDPRDQEQPESQPRQGQEIVGSIASLSEQTLAVDLANAEFDRLIASAHRYPRQIKVCLDQAEQMILYDEASVDNAVYALPRGGKPIVGPSIGFANTFATSWGNCWDYGAWMHTDRREKVVVGQGVFIDWQTNRRVSISEQRRIVDSKGRLFSDDMIIVTSKAAAAVARRNAILAGIPRPLWFPVYEKALFVMRGTEATLPEKREQAVKAMAAFGITPKQIFLYLDVKDIGAIGIEHIPTLRGMYAQLRDGAVTPEEMFDPRRMMGRGFDTVENPLADEADAETGEVKATAKPSADGAGQVDTAADDAEAAEAAAEAKAAKPASKAAETQAKPADPIQASSAAITQAGAAAPAGITQKATETPAAAKAEPAKADPAAPKMTSDEYVEAALAWLDAADERGWPAINIEERWKGERKQRETIGVVEDDFDKVNGRYRTVLADAKKREKAAASK